MNKILKKEVSTEEFVKYCVDLLGCFDSCKKCGNFGKYWSCPPLETDALELWREYDRVFIYGKVLQTPAGQSWEEYIDLYVSCKMVLTEELLSLENDGALAVFPGKCELCESCARKENKPCRHPDKCRRTAASIGIVAQSVLEKYFDEKIVWGKDGRPPEHSILLGCVLKGKKNG